MVDLKNDVDKDAYTFINLTFDHPLSSIELSDTIQLLSNCPMISQVYFKDECDLATLEKAKYLLEAMPTVMDEQIEKYIIKEFDHNDQQRLMAMNFINIDTWNISYSKEGNCHLITSLAKYRKTNEWMQNLLNNIKDEDLSPLEKICYIYDRVKLLEYDSSDNYQRLPEIINDEKANANGYNLVFKELLKKINIPAVVEKVQINNDDDYVCLAKINDEKYDLNGIYIFNPSFDTIAKEQYKNGWARRMNYNFFGLTLDKLYEMDNQVTFLGILKIFKASSLNEFKQQIKMLERRNALDTFLDFTKELELTNDEAYHMIKNTTAIVEEDLLKIISQRLSIEPIAVIDQKIVIDMVGNNYQEREKELFKFDSNKLLIK